MRCRQVCPGKIHAALSKPAIADATTTSTAAWAATSAAACALEAAGTHCMGGGDCGGAGVRSLAPPRRRSDWWPRLFSAARKSYRRPLVADRRPLLVAGLWLTRWRR